MWENLRSKYMQTAFASGVAGIWGYLLGNDNWSNILNSIKSQVVFGVYGALIVFSVFLLIVTYWRRRKERFDDLDRAHGIRKD